MDNNQLIQKIQGDLNAEEEIVKCMRSPYYFATTYLKVDGKPFTTHLSEDEFNKQYHDLKKSKRNLTIRNRYHGYIHVPTEM